MHITAAFCTLHSHRPPSSETSGRDSLTSAAIFSYEILAYSRFLTRRFSRLPGERVTAAGRCGLEAGGPRGVGMKGSGAPRCDLRGASRLRLRLRAGWASGGRLAVGTVGNVVEQRLGLRGALLGLCSPAFLAR